MRLFVYFVVVFGMAAGTYQAVGTFDFLTFDDQVYVTENRAVRRGSSGLAEIWSSSEMPKNAMNWPIIFTSFWLEYRFWQLNPLGFHWTNVLLHGLASSLLGLWVFELIRLRETKSGELDYPRRRWNPSITPTVWATAALFAVHPVHVSSVAWVTERKNVLSGVFFFACLLTYARYRQTDRWQTYATFLLLLVLALLSKSSVVIAPLVCILIDLFFCGPVTSSGLFRRHVIPLLLCMAAGVATVAAEKGTLAVATLLDHAGDLPLPERLGGALIALAFYTNKLVVPTGLRLFYDWDPEYWHYLAAASVFAAMAGVIVFARALQLPREVPFGLSVFVVGVLPVSGIVSFGWIEFSPVGNHLVYLPSAGLILAAVSLGAFTAGRMNAAPAISLLFTVVLGTFALLAFRESLQWKDSETRLTEIDVTSSNHRVRGVKASWLLAQASYDEALDFVAGMVADFPGVDLCHVLYSDVLARRSRDDAIRYLRKCLEERDSTTWAVQLGNLLQQAGRYDEALPHLERAARVAPTPDLLRSIGAIWAYKRDFERARPLLESAARLDRFDHEARFNLAVVLAETGDLAQARRQFEYCLWLEPTFEPAQRALAQLPP